MAFDCHMKCEIAVIVRICRLWCRKSENFESERCCKVGGMSDDDAEDDMPFAIISH